MKCDKIRDLLLTDHLDGETSGDLSREVEKHLDACKGCREFYAVLKENVVIPFKSLEPMEAPREMWEGIRDRIEKRSIESERRSVFDIFSIPMPLRRAAMATAGVMAVVFLLSGVGAWRLYDKGLTQKYVELQLSYFSESDMDAEPVNGGGFGSDVEELFF